MNGVRAVGALRIFILTKAFSEEISKTIQNGFFSLDQIKQAAKAESATLMSNVALEKLRWQLYPCAQAAVKLWSACSPSLSHQIRLWMLRTLRRRRDTPRVPLWRRVGSPGLKLWS